MRRSEQVSRLAAGVGGRGGAGDGHGRFCCELLPVFLARRTHGLQAEQRPTDQILILNKESDVAAVCSLGLVGAGVLSTRGCLSAVFLIQAASVCSHCCRYI